MLPFFSTHMASSAKQVKVDPRIIRKLTAIRLSNYSVLSMKREIVEADYPIIQDLILNLGDKLLSAQEETAHDALKFSHARGLFKKIINEIARHHQHFIHYAADLVQYYTILCDDQFNETFTAQQFQQFLLDHQAQLGEADDNLWIIEYQLIKTYNDLVELQDAINHKTPAHGNPEESLHVLITHLGMLKSKIDTLILNIPDSVFVHYLHFSTHYTCAKAFEVQFSCSKSTLSDEEILFLSESQQEFIKIAAEALDKITELDHYVKERKMPFAKGLEYCFGQTLLNKFPCQNIDQIKEHIALLSDHGLPLK